MVASPTPGSEVPADAGVVLDLYKLAVEQVDRISARRASANSYFLTIHTALAAVVGVLAAATGSGDRDLPRFDDVALFVTAGIGILLSATWWLLLRSYRDLNAAKFKVITEIEASHLPVKIFEREWEILKADDVLPWWRGRYAELGFVERVVPVLFLSVYVALGMRLLMT
ncbi:MAG: hypothetical protein LC808_41825 [Actinobacteria bacterium]|nr:hypothetical protein [Actinomycetota bacterium]